MTLFRNSVTQNPKKIGLIKFDLLESGDVGLHLILVSHVNFYIIRLWEN